MDTLCGIRFLLIEHQTLVRESLAEILRLGGHVAAFAEAGSETEALAWLHRAQASGSLPDLILVDPFAPGSSGIDTLRKLRAVDPALRIIGLSSTTDEGIIRDAICNGASGYVSKRASSHMLLETIRVVLAGGFHVPPRTFGAGDHAATEGEANADLPVDAESLGLTKRQTEVLALLMRGHTNKMICRALGIAPGTCKAHVAAIFRIIGARNRNEVASTVRRAHLKLPVSPSFTG